MVLFNKMVAACLLPSVVFLKGDEREKNSGVGRVGKGEIRVGDDVWWMLICFEWGWCEAKKRGRICNAFWFGWKGNMGATALILEGWAGSKSALRRGYCWSLVCRKK